MLHLLGVRRHKLGIFFFSFIAMIKQKFLSHLYRRRSPPAPATSATESPKALLSPPPHTCSETIQLGISDFETFSLPLILLFSQSGPAQGFVVPKA